MKKRLKSFIYASQGLRHAFCTQPNFRIHIACTFAVIIAGILLHLTSLEWTLLVIAIGFVLTAELFNTAIEVTMDLISPQIHPTVKIIKDVSAGAVLIASISAAVLGCIILVPKILSAFS